MERTSLTPELIKVIRRDHKKGKTWAEIMKEHNVARSSVWKAIRGTKTRRRISKPKVDVRSINTVLERVASNKTEHEPVDISKASKIIEKILSSLKGDILEIHLNLMLKHVNFKCKISDIVEVE